MADFDVLKPAQLGNLQLRNRLIVPPMVTQLANADGTVSDELVAYASARAAGGWGLYVVEATYVDPKGRGFTHGLGLDDDDKLPGLRRLTKAVHDHGGKISIQLHHAGRETSSAITGSMILAPSDCSVCYSDEPVHELSKAEIKEIIDSFGAAAKRAKKSGFDAVMIHGAHGYLPGQFLSPYTNKRTDEYGGPLANRLRISREIIESVRGAVGPDFPVTYRMTVEEAIPGGLSLQEGAQAAKMLSKLSIDCLHVVAGNYAVNQVIIPPAAYGDIANKRRLQTIRNAVGPDFPLAVAGRVTNIFQAENLYQEGLVNFIAMGRASLADPDLPKEASEGKWNLVRSCIGCNDGCIGRTSKELSVSCAINPTTGHENEVKSAQQQKKMLVIGGGPAGMESAWLLAKQGNDVVLYEKNDSLGGQFRLAALPPHKNDIFTYLDHMKKRLAAAGVEVHLNCEVDAPMLEKEKPDLTVLASGGQPVQIPFPGLDSIEHVLAEDLLLNGLDALGQRVAVIGGGMVGCETVEYIAETGREVSIIEMQPEILSELFFTVKDALLARLYALNVKIYKDSKVQNIKDGCIHTVSANGSANAIGPVDSIVIALDVKPHKPLEEEIEKLNLPYIKIGDCQKPGNCQHATQTAFVAIMNL